MRLHRLWVTAFGPFAGMETVDFDELSTAGLFLFTGPTGAGKTSILDAVCFALYGQVPGARQQGVGRASLRSDHAAEGVAPQVVLEVTLRGRRLRVTRSAAWERPKQRGDGTTTQQARVLVEEAVGDGWTTHTTRLDEAGHLLGGLLGLTVAQFCQVVLLPQGQFAEFLRADADRRRALLETLFDTRRFADVESWLVTRRQVTARDLGELDDQLRQLLARVAEASGEEPPSGLTDRLDDTELAHWLDDLVARSRATETAAGEAAGATAAAAEAAAQALADAERFVGVRRRAAALQTRQTALAAARPARDAAMAELAEARTVAPLLPVLAEAGRLQTELEDARAHASAAHGRLVTVLAATGTTGRAAPSEVSSVGGAATLPALAVVRTASRATAEEAATLALLAEQEAEAAELTRQADELQRTAVELAAKATKAAEWLAGAAERRSVLEAARDAARLASASLPAVEQDRDAAAARLEAALRRDAVRDQLVAAMDERRIVVDRHQAARDALQSLRARRLAGMAAELAAGLLPGADCPVCGSTEHPRPALPGDSVAAAEDEEAAEAAVLQAETARHDGESLVARLDVELAAQRAAAGGDTTVEELETHLDAADQRLADAVAVAARLEAAQGEFVRFGQEAERRERDRVADESEQRSAASRAVDSRSRAERLTAELAAARGDDPSITARRERLQRTASDLDGLVGHLSDIDRLEAAVVSALGRVDEAIQRAGAPIGRGGARSRSRRRPAQRARGADPPPRLRARGRHRAARGP